MVKRVQAVLLALTLCAAPASPEAPEAEPVLTSTPTLRPARFGLHFFPATLFALALWVEGDLHLGGGVSLFANVGGGALKQVGWEGGLRLYAGGEHLNGLYADVRFSGFCLPEYGLLMAGPAAHFGHSWKLAGYSVAVGVGFTTYFTLHAGRPGVNFMGAAPIEGDLILLPGVARGPVDRPAVMPAVRFAIGPWF